MASTQSETAVVACPGCGSRLSVPRSMIGQRARCAACSLAFTISAPAAPQAPPKAPAKAPQPKPPEPAPEVPEHVGFDCRVCNTRLFARTEDVGKKLQCPDCGAQTVIPPPPPPKKKNMPAALEGEQYELWDIDEQPLPSQLIAAEPKSITIKCRRCDTVMHPTVNLVGQPIRCPDCGTPNIVPPPPRPVVKPTVLAPDALTPFPDPDAHPGERPLVLPPAAKMLHEEENEDEYARALEKSQRTGKPMEIDRHGRPILPRWPLISGVLPFLFSRGVPVLWIALSLAYAGATWVLLTGIAMASGNGAFTGVPMLAGGSALMMICTAAAYSCLLQIVMESSEGNRAVYNWPALTDWLVSLLWMGVAVPMSAVPGWAIARIFFDGATDTHVTALCNGVSILVFLPIIMLSQLDINSPAGVLSGRILASLFRCPFSWAFFYFELAAFAATCGGATYLLESHYPDQALWLFPLYMAALILAARLLGRLAWRLAEAMPIEEEIY